ncbi:hypothetical protein BMS3Abin16_00713 [archaeon BMS3Abin16]|nr:hypothetical protein BMS3Abin16_00713 [archaeon BMS3Abin16]
MIKKGSDFLPIIRNIGLFFFLGGLLILLAYGTAMILAASETPMIIRLGVLGILIGFVILIATLIREQYNGKDSDFKV